MQPDISSILKKFQSLPRFSDGRIDYSTSAEAPVVTVFVQYGDEILLLKRSENVSSYRGKWNNVGGYIDEGKPLTQKAIEELGEELGIDAGNIEVIDMLGPETVRDESIGKTWIKFFGRAMLKRKPEITLDFEHTEYKWVKPEEIKNFDCVPGLWESWEKVSKLNN